MQKRGQVTIFIILGLVILLGAGLLLYLQPLTITVNKSTTDTILTQAPRADPIQEYVEACMTNVGKEAVYLIASQGGYIEPSGAEKYQEPGDGASFYDYYYWESFRLPYVLNEQTIKLRPLSEMEKMITNYLILELEPCLNQMKPFTDQGYSFEAPVFSLENSQIKASSRIQEEEIEISLNWPLQVTKGDQEKTVSYFETKIPLRLGKLHNLTSIFLQDLAVSPMLDLSSKCQSYLTRQEEEDDYLNIYLESNLQTYEYAFRIVDSSPDGLPLKFQAALKNVEVEGECVD